MSSTYSSKDYMYAAIERKNDGGILRDISESIIIAAYISGVSVECILRSHIVKNSKQFDSKHDLQNLLIESKILDNLSVTARTKLSEYVRILNKKWENNLRYQSMNRTKRVLAHDLARINRKRVGKYLENYYKEVIEVSTKIIEMGERHGFTRND